jgi:hypothetical protein
MNPACDRSRNWCIAARRNLVAMPDWATMSSLATAGGTLALAAATYSAVRSANRSARIAEETRQAGLRPVLVSSRLHDPAEKVGWIDNHWAKVEGGGAVAEEADGNIYLAASVRNVGAGIAVFQGWWVSADVVLGPEQMHVKPEEFRRQTRDLYIPAGDVGFWQGALREQDDDAYFPILRAIEQRQRFVVDLLYTDHEGGQRTISRFALTPRQESGWLCTVARHWNLDRQDPR